MSTTVGFSEIWKAPSLLSVWATPRYLQLPTSLTYFKPGSFPLGPQSILSSPCAVVKVYSEPPSLGSPPITYIATIFLYGLRSLAVADGMRRNHVIGMGPIVLPQPWPEPAGSRKRELIPSLWIF